MGTGTLFVLFALAGACVYTTAFLLLRETTLVPEHEVALAVPVALAALFLLTPLRETWNTVPQSVADGVLAWIFFAAALSGALLLYGVTRWKWP
jgi:hypothetical protein